MSTEWWCPKCQCVVAGADISFCDTHDVDDCGSVLLAREPEKPQHVIDAEGVRDLALSTFELLKRAADGPVEIDGEHILFIAECVKQTAQFSIRMIGQRAAADRVLGPIERSISEILHQDILIGVDLPVRLR